MSNIEYRELKSFDEFRECVTLQKEIFGLSDIDAISPLIISMFAKEMPPIGFVIGAVDNSQWKEKLVGFVFSTAVLCEDALYFLLVGVHPEYQNENIGFGLLKKLREISLPKGIKYFYCIFDPLEGNLGNYYFSKLGLWGIKYEESPYELTLDNHPNNIIPTDKIVTKWDIDNPRTYEKMEGTYQGKIKIEEILSKYPVINENKFDDNDTILVRIPENFIALKKKNIKEALNWRFSTRKIFDEYINNRGYLLTEFYSQKKEGKRDNYYLLEKK